MKCYVAAEGKAEYLKSPHGVPIIIDVLKATSTIIAALWCGAERVIPVVEIEDARALGKKHGAFLLGERGGVLIEGFDLNNSPLHMLRTDLKGKTIVMTTSNGTRVMVEGGIIASTFNAGAVAQQVHDKERAYLLASGAPLKSEEDLYCAMMVEFLCDKLNEGKTLEQSIDLLLKEKAGLFDGIRTSDTAVRLTELGFGKDIANICAGVNRYPIIPVYRSGEIRL